MGERWQQSSGRPVKSAPRTPAVCWIWRGTSAGQCDSRDSTTRRCSAAQNALIKPVPGCYPRPARLDAPTHPTSPCCLDQLRTRLSPPRGALLGRTPKCWRKATRGTGIKTKEPHSFYVTHRGPYHSPARFLTALAPCLQELTQGTAYCPPEQMRRHPATLMLSLSALFLGASV